MTPQIRPSSALLKKLGFAFAEWGDSTFLFGVVGAGVKVWKILNDEPVGEPPLDWIFPFQRLYLGEQRILWWTEPSSGKRIYLPQAVLLDAEAAVDESAIRVELLEEDFVAAATVPAGLEYYRRRARREGKI